MVAKLRTVRPCNALDPLPDMDQSPCTLPSYEKFECFESSGHDARIFGQFIKAHGALSDKALIEPVTITRNGRDRLVLVSAEAFEALRRTSCRARPVEKLEEDEITAIARSKVPAGHALLNALLDD